MQGETGICGQFPTGWTRFMVRIRKNVASKNKVILTGAVILGCCFAVVSCHRSESVSLSIDFSQASTWRYMFGVDITGTIKTPDSSRRFSSGLRTYLSGEGSPHDKGAVRFRTGRSMITSTVLDEQERAHLERTFENQEFYLSPKEGAYRAMDTALPPLINIGGWDLFRSFARVLPVLPESRVRPGGSWDRERTFQIETSKGNGIGWLYQYFTLDSLAAADSSHCAAVSWRFSYRIQPDPATLIDSLPLEGSGTGNALIDIVRKRIIKANAFFDVPARSNARVAVSWQETVHLELVN
jgi:hypothetical protein